MNRAPLSHVTPLVELYILKDNKTEERTHSLYLKMVLTYGYSNNIA